MNIRDPRLPDRFWSKVAPDPNSGCWLWTAAADRHGYGRYNTGSGFPMGKPRRGEVRPAHGPLVRLAHRVCYEALAGRVDSHLVIDHLCRNPACVNPSHLEPVTQKTNSERGIWWSSRRILRLKSITHCPRGHEYTQANTIITRTGARSCRECNRVDCVRRRKEGKYVSRGR